jgi:peptidoglycan-N-acetylglucosamine deacetylase
MKQRFLNTTLGRALLAGVGLCLGLAVFLTFAIRRSLPITSVATTELKIAITFDDGPNPVYTLRAANLLSRYSARGTFFQLGRNVLMHPTLTELLSYAGHELGNHGFSHQAVGELSFFDQKREIEATESIFNRKDRQKQYLYRPPYGRAPWLLQLWLWSTGRKMVLWSEGGTVPDYLRQDPNQLAQQMIKAIRPGAILVFHDGEGLRPEMLEALKLVLDYTRQEKYRVVTVSELLALPK